jgi:CzcA family heavy metal efflux pump
MTPRWGSPLMRWIVKSSLRFRYLVIAGATAMMVVGTLQLQQSRVDVFPEFAPPLVEIQTICLGLSTADVESLVTVPLEQVMNGLPGLDDVRSKSVPQLSDIQLVFKEHADLFEARQLVQERLLSVQNSLPTWAAPPVMLPPVSATSRVMQIGMTSKHHSLIEMSMMAYWTVRARLLRVPGVANVAIWGERLQMMTVQVDPKKLQQKNVTLDTVMEATSDSVDHGLLRFSNGSVIGTGGGIETNAGQRVGIQHVLPIVAPADLAKVSMATKDGNLIRIGDVADVKYDHQPLIGDAVIGDGPGLLLVVEKLPWGNTIDITRGIQDAIDSLQPGLPDINFNTEIFRQSNFIDLAVQDLAQALLLGFLLVVLILLFFLYEWRVAVVSVAAIPLSLMVALLVLNVGGATINTMTLAGLVIALGAVVDDAIIDIENILRRLRQRRLAGDTTPTARVILHAVLEVRSPIVYATLIIVAAAAPVFLLQGLTGAFFQPLALAYTLAIVASMLVALTVTPALALVMLRNVPVERHHSPVARWLQERYTRGLKRIVRRPRRTYAVFGLLTIGSLLVIPQLGSSLFPAFQERDFLVHWITTPGTSADEETRMIMRLSKDLEAIHGVRSFGSHIGQAFLGEEVQGVNFGECWISLDSNADYTPTLDAIDGVIQKYPGLYRDQTTYLNERIEEVLTGSKEPIIVRVYGQELPVIRGLANEIERKIAPIRGITDDHTDLEIDTPQIEVKVDLAKAAKYGLKPGDVRRAASTLVAGEEVGDIFRAGKAYDTVVWSTPTTRSNVGSIASLPIDTPDGAVVHIGDVAQVTVQPVPNVIERENASRRIDVGAAVEGRDLGSTVADVKSVLRGIKFPLGYHYELLGEYAERQNAQNLLFEAAIVAALVIFLLLQTAFGSWRLAILAFVTLPMALVGGVLAAFATGGNISLGALLGFFTVFGIAARNGILLINHCQHLERFEGEPFGRDLVLRGARERLSPILMTTLATGLAVVPLVVLGERPGSEIEYPLAIVIIGGLITSTLLNLFVVPSLYLRFGRRRGEGSVVPSNA